MLVALVLVHCLLVSQSAESKTENTHPNNSLRQEISLCPADRLEPWTYRGRNGPMYWGETYPQCYGKQQSPIDIKTKEAIPRNDLEKLELNNYDRPMTSATVENNGHTVQITPTDEVKRSITVNGSEYDLRQFHFHWGYTYARGSEHYLDGKQYAMELHFVHMNENSEIAVVGVIFQEGRQANAALQKIVETFPEVKYKGNTTTLKSSVNLDKMLPENPASYFRYQGSLTTPECAEGVSWSVLPKLLTVGRNQMTEFRKLYSATKENATFFCRLSGNYRPLQPLNGREVFASQ